MLFDIANYENRSHYYVQKVLFLQKADVVYATDVCESDDGHLAAKTMYFSLRVAASCGQGESSTRILDDVVYVIDVCESNMTDIFPQSGCFMWTGRAFHPDSYIVQRRERDAATRLSKFIYIDESTQSTPRQHQHHHHCGSIPSSSSSPSS